MKQVFKDARRLLAAVCLLVTTFTLTASAQTMLEEKKLFPLDPQTSALFGYSVGVTRNTMVVGAFLADTAVPSSGAAYVFEKMGGRWVEVDELSPAESFSWFGSSSAINSTADVIVVGAPQARAANGDPVGAVYVFRKIGSQWVREAKLTAKDLTPGGEFGGDEGVAIDGDTIVVGANFNHSNVPGNLLGAFGAAYVFQRTPTGWKQTAKLIHPRGETFSEFGTAVAINGGTIAIGAPSANIPGNSFGGAVYVYNQVNGAWTNTATLIASDADTTFFNGSSVSMTADTIVSGTDGASNANGDLTGAAYVYRRDKTGAWQQEAKLLPGDGLPGDSFGDRLAIAGNTILVGADFHPNTAGDPVGSAYVYQRIKGVWKQTTEMMPSDGQPFGEFGCSIATDGRTLVVGAGKQGVSAGSFSGEAYTYELK
jgi:hypothetical protein